MFSGTRSSVWWVVADGVCVLAAVAAWLIPMPVRSQQSGRQSTGVPLQIGSADVIAIGHRPSVDAAEAIRRPSEAGSPGPATDGRLPEQAVAQSTGSQPPDSITGDRAGGTKAAVPQVPAATSWKLPPFDLHELQSLLQKGDLRTAVYAASIICKQQPRNPYGPLGMGMVLVQSASYPEAIDILRRALELNAETERNPQVVFWGNLNLATAYVNMGQLSKAREALAQAKQNTARGGAPHIAKVEEIMNR